MELVNQPFTEKGQKTLDALVEASRKNFYEKGYYKTTIKDITKDAGVSVGAFYLYFEDKLSVYKYLVTTYGKFIRNHLREQIGEVDSRWEAERKGLIAYIELVRKHPDIYNIVWESLYIDREIFFTYYDEFAESYARQLNRAKDQGEMSFKNSEVVSFMLMGVHTFLGLKYGTINDQDDVEAIADEAMDIMKNGFYRKT